jgi:hypothetical protein
MKKSKAKKNSKLRDLKPKKDPKGARLDNDPNLPEHGSLKITIRGGK